MWGYTLYCMFVSRQGYTLSFPYTYMCACTVAMLSYIKQHSAWSLMCMHWRLALLPPSLLTGKKECTLTLLLSRSELILERKSAPLHFSLPAYLPNSNWQEECTLTTAASPLYWQERVYPYTVPPSNTRELTFVYHHTILTPTSQVTLAGKIVTVGVNAGVNL